MEFFQKMFINYRRSSMWKTSECKNRIQVYT